MLRRDRVTRGELTARIKSKGNASTELAMTAILRRRRVTGWRRHVRVLGFRPDFVFRKTKIAANMYRDAVQNDELRRNGWTVVRIWEHDLKKGETNGFMPIAAGSR